MSIKNSKTTLLVVIIFCLGLYNSFSALGATNPDPAGEDFIRSLRDQVLSTLTPKELSEAERKSNFEKILDRYFDINRMARMSLGRYWRKADKGERNEFILQFKAMVVNTYAERFKSYSGEFKNGQFKKGKLLWGSGSKYYEGQFQNGKPQRTRRVERQKRGFVVTKSEI